MFIRASTRSRSGAAVIEMAVVGSVALFILVGMMDMGIAVWTFNNIAEAAREGARYAVVHGSKTLPNPNGGPCGPAADNADIDKQVRNYVGFVDPKVLKVHSTWPNGNNDPNSPVTVQVTYDFSPCLFLRIGTIRLNTSVTMTICH